MKDKFIRKWMKVAKTLADDNVPCLSRGIGSVIVDPATNCIVSTGYNGIPRGLPDADSYEHLKEYVYPQLTNEEACYMRGVDGTKEQLLGTADEFARLYEGCGKCPRKIVGAKSGARLELCDCSHSESNAVKNAALNGRATNNCYIFCWCGIPCTECVISIIQAGISKVFCLEEDSGPIDNVYGSWRSLWKFNKAGIEIFTVKREWVLEEN